MYEEKQVDEPVKRVKLGRIIRKAGEWNENHTQCEPFDTIEGYVLETSYNMLKQSEQAMREEYRKLHDQIEKSKKETVNDDEEKNKEHLNLMVDILRLDKCVRRLDKRMRKTKDDDVAVRCANAIGLIEGKKLLLIQAVTSIKKIWNKEP